MTCTTLQTNLWFKIHTENIIAWKNSNTKQYFSTIRIVICKYLTSDQKLKSSQFLCDTYFDGIVDRPTERPLAEYFWNTRTRSSIMSNYSVTLQPAADIRAKEDRHWTNEREDYASCHVYNNNSTDICNAHVSHDNISFKFKRHECSCTLTLLLSSYRFDCSQE